jgi:hypothetical protein
MFGSSAGRRPHQRGERGGDAGSRDRPAREWFAATRTRRYGLRLLRPSGSVPSVRAVVIASVLAACASRTPPQPAATAAPQPAATAAPQPAAADHPSLKTVASFDAIADPHARSAALFLEASRVFFHPRCINCHPAGDSPAQITPDRPHDPPVTRGVDDRGVVGMRCTTCHQDHNLELSRVPGAPEWHLAPKTMAWVNHTPQQICEQMKDKKRNGGRTLAQIVEHNAHDQLVGWGWHPGHGREPAPGTQEQLGALMAAWVKTGAECPREGERP